MLTMELGGVRLRLNPAAISAIRYRAEYGASILTHLAQAKTREETEARLLRMCWQMIPPAERPELLEFARLARRGPRFVQKALGARNALLDVDPAAPREEDAAPEAFDEYALLATMAAAHMDMSLIHELPALHLYGIAARYFRAQNPDSKTYRPASREERESLYPRRKKAAVPHG